MTYLLSANQLKEMIGSDVVHPAIEEEACRRFGAVADAIRQIGLPRAFADWFKSIDRATIFTDANGKTVVMNDEVRAIGDCLLIGTSEFGIHVVDERSGYVIDIDSAGPTILINTSIDRFLHFVAYFNEADSTRYSDLPRLRNAFEEIDGCVLRDPEGIWSVMLEEAEAGLY